MAKIIDAHAHIYPDRIAGKATQSIGEFYELPMQDLGCAACLLDSGREIGVEKYIVHSVATDPNKVARINDFLAQSVSEHAEFVGFMTLHPAMTEKQAGEEIARAVALGLDGIKLHPDIQRFHIDGEEALRLYKANDSRLPILLHTGDCRYDYSCPSGLARAAKLFPRTIFIGAHFGGYTRWDELDCYLDKPNVFFDTSSSLFRLDAEKAAELIRRHGSQRFFWGTDFPLFKHKTELEQLMALDLTDREREDILYHNIKRALPIW